jgi:Ni,Fe-hydrogenase III small subunit
MVLPVAKPVAVPDNIPVKFVAANEVKPVTEVAVLPKVSVVEPKVVVLFANCAFVIPADEFKFAVVNPVTEIVPEAIVIPDPAVNPS